jgi:UPF0755 protein
MKLLKLGCAGLLLAVVAAAAVLAYLLWPHSGPPRETFVEIPRGAGSREMAALLRDRGVIRTEWEFMIIRALRRGVNLQAGEYRFAGPASAWTVYDRIGRGDVYYHEVIIPEGRNIFDIAETVGALKFIKSSEFLKIARDPALVRDIAPEAPSLEGYLYPATYRITRGGTAMQLCRMMNAEFRRVWKELSPPPGTNVHEMVTLASLVEKETGVPDERKTVSSLYRNRLRIGMRLDCDPTVIYAALLEGRYRGTIYRSDLENPHPYNTYRNPGLPPGPIANPGRASLDAALRPAATDYLFMVAKPDGSGAHTFTTELGAHNAAVQELRRAAPR